MYFNLIIQLINILTKFYYSQGMDQQQLTEICIVNEENFQKYPKSFLQNIHYREIKENILTDQDEQEIIKFPLQKIQQNTPVQSFRKINSNTNTGRKSKDKTFQIVPMKTISYSSPVNLLNADQFAQTMRQSKLNKPQNKFDSKSIFSNMKKLQNLRKNNYKKKVVSNEKPIKNGQKQTQIQMKLDLFKMTSTNFNYKQKVKYPCPEEQDILKKLSESQGGKRNKIKFKQVKNINLENQNQLHQQTQDKSNGNEQFNCLQPVKYETQITKESDKLVRNSSVKHIAQVKHFQSVSKQKYERTSRKGYRNSDKGSDFSQQKNIFMKYSEYSLLNEKQTIKKGLKILNQGISSSIFEQQQKRIDHMNSPFKATFRIKHIEDNKNILMTTIKKKARSLSKDQLLSFIKKVVK